VPLRAIVAARDPFPTTQKDQTMTTITKTFLQTLRDDMNAALDAVAKQHGIAISVDGCRYDAAAGTGTYKLNIAANIVPGESAAEARRRSDYERHCELFGAKREWLGKTFRTPRGVLVIVGLETKRTKYPIVCREPDGVVRLYPVDTVKRAMAIDFEHA
jgi:hypothetical protein